MLKHLFSLKTFMKNAGYDEEFNEIESLIERLENQAESLRVALEAHKRTKGIITEAEREAQRIAREEERRHAEQLTRSEKEVVSRKSASAKINREALAELAHNSGNRPTQQPVELNSCILPNQSDLYRLYSNYNLEQKEPKLDAPKPIIDAIRTHLKKYNSELLYLWEKEESEYSLDGIQMWTAIVAVYPDKNSDDEYIREMTSPQFNEWDLWEVSPDDYGSNSSTEIEGKETRIYGEW